LGGREDPSTDRKGTPDGLRKTAKRKLVDTDRVVPSRNLI